MFSSFLKFNSTVAPWTEGKDRYFNGLEQEKPEIGNESDFDPKWREIGVNIVVILVFFALEEVHKPIG
jgi:hypothetical protein